MKPEFVLDSRSRIWPKDTRLLIREGEGVSIESHGASVVFSDGCPAVDFDALLDKARVRLTQMCFPKLWKSDLEWMSEARFGVFTPPEALTFCVGIKKGCYHVASANLSANLELPRPLEQVWGRIYVHDAWGTMDIPQNMGLPLHEVLENMAELVCEWLKPKTDAPNPVRPRLFKLGCLEYLADHPEDSGDLPHETLNDLWADALIVPNETEGDAAFDSWYLTPTGAELLAAAEDALEPIRLAPREFPSPGGDE